MRNRIPILPLLNILVIFLALIASVQPARIAQQSLHERKNNIALVKTRHQGTFLGSRVDEQVDEFVGIPYAQPPLSDLRFAKTKPLGKYKSSGIRHATKYGPACLQPSDQVTNGTSEDCLYLNIWKPHGLDKAEKVPVLFWMHGGSWTVGAGSLSFFNGTSLVRFGIALNEPVVIVTINYRLGAFGFLAGPEMLAADKKGTAALNAGMFDQREALRWVHENIGAFGGDKKRVTIWGQSSGANSVAGQMLAKSGDNEGLFARAILQSGNQGTLARFPADAKVPLNGFKALLNATGCLDASPALPCLRKVAVDVLDKANTDLYFSAGPVFTPVQDSFFIEERPSIQFKKGRINKAVSFIHGCTLDDGTQLAVPYVKNLYSDEDTFSTIMAFYGDAIDSVRQDVLQVWPNIPSKGEPNRPYYFGSSPNDTFYPPGPNGEIDQYKRLSSFLHDILFEAGRRQQLYGSVRLGVSAWSYRFAQPTPEGAPLAQFQSSPSLGVQHASDLPYVFAMPPIAPASPSQPEALKPFVTDKLIEKTSRTMTAAWIHFATHGNPNGKYVPYWPTYDEYTPGKKVGTELIFQPEGFQTERDDYHLNETQFILDNADAFGL